uniref:NADH-plastoquinone oxidoreductase subunit K n=4 Tax=Keteleeria TaxID=3323 RepID=A0A8F2XT90_9CONI|nr:NADH-plastoquinone oxidoreductase subunit K [Keteleeria evelyniana]QHO05361.1 NADH-plastoquinone oxidoreductase subunit K [Keteleeria hainanensis]QWW91965.1 NADH-plastoquinone oxidoreductase subunit K [Keteleeria fortunei var. cyclolepis]QXI88834.1 NADH-plastoquinone oxidoreductase subunit K [Keteleeria davidiana]UWI54228.1 NADH-plastoquinone oxidoreductase subunit K [Keteleeria evelyniana var. pendula]QOW07137.1 NADH-plastoquinone oxidoreductase subunit K [Keteleeria evelyniana]
MRSEKEHRNGLYLVPSIRRGGGGREVKNDIKRMINPIKLPLLDQTIPNPVKLPQTIRRTNWARLSSIWPLLYGTSCVSVRTE